ncbi:hypothetical protein IFO70_01510 [Phormidium tenue FACHB-886]|nr:hypothetical protein [Phormidium tenue FACHB-886]
MTKIWEINAFISSRLDRSRALAALYLHARSVCGKKAVQTTFQVLY